MNILIKNNTDKFRKCVLFGNYDRCLGNKADENDFLSFETHDGIEIFIDGSNNEKKRLSFLESLSKDTFTYNYLEYSNSRDNLNDLFYLFTSDANGKINIEPIIPSIFIDAKSVYPIKILGKNFKSINAKTSFLFLIRPNQEIKLNFVK